MSPENTSRRTAVPLLIVATIMSLTGCHAKPSAADTAALPQVMVMHPVSREITPEIELTATVAPSATVTLIARVQGTLEAIGFTDGAYVKQGQLLFRIEPDSYRAQLAYDQAALDNADQELTRQKQLTEDSATSTSSLQKAEATRDQARAKRDMSKINLGYTDVKAPFCGRMSARSFDVGNFVGTSDTAKLATLDRIQPVYVNFTLNERDANRIGLFTRPPQTVRVSTPGTSARHDDARLEFVDTRIDPATGTLKLRADVANQDGHLIPGMSVLVHVAVDGPRTALLVPDTAILHDQAGTSVFVVDQAGMTSRRPVTPGDLYGSLRAIFAGLGPADRVVTSGVLSIAPGTKVQATDDKNAS